MSDLGPIFFYNGTEPTGPATVPITIRGVGDDCSNPPQPVIATYQVRTPDDTNRPATSGTDYLPIPSKQSQPLYGYHAQGPTEQPDNVPIQPDFEPEPVIEEAEALISGSTGTREVPWDVPVYIIDNDGLDRASFEHGGPYERAEIYGSLVVPVFRAGPATGAGTYDFSITGSSASPATEGEDFTLASHTVSFAANERVKFITVQLVNDKRSEATEEATFTLSSPGTLLPADPVSTVVRILDGAGGAA
ncbi:MAG: Calx-beta domain-containing protein, partial [Actinomycetota bacterium]